MALSILRSKPRGTKYQDIIFEDDMDDEDDHLTNDRVTSNGFPEDSHHEPDFGQEGTNIVPNGTKVEKAPPKLGLKLTRKSTSNGNSSSSSSSLNGGGSEVKQNKMNRLSSKKGNKQWVHPPEALLRGHIVYNVKFLGHVEVEQPKGTEVVRDAIRKMKFNKQLKKAEGQKPPKVELTISVDGVTVQEPKLKIIKHQYALHRISYCADDKTDKRMFTFIAKESDRNIHHCFVFDSEKCAEEITLTIGQAFDLAYRKFMESSSKDMDMKKQYLLLQKKVKQLTDENLKLKARVADLERIIDPKVLDNFDKNKAVPKEDPVVGRRLENLVLDEQPYTNGTSEPTVYASVQRPQGTPSAQPTQGTPVLAPPPPIPNRTQLGTPSTPSQKTQNNSGVDLFGSTPFNAETPTIPAPSIPPRTTPQNAQNPFSTPTKSSGDPFGMGSFNPSSTTQDLDQQIQNVDRELMDLQTGFSQGLSFGTDDFSLADLDPLNQK